jgi:hypothetical protein
MTTETAFDRLSADDRLLVWHGSNLSTAADFVVNGIDARQKVKRHFPHYVKIDEGRPALVDRGLFVSPSRELALSFGRVCVAFEVVARDLLPIFPPPGTVREDNRMWRQFFPDSFRPSLSAYLSGRAWKSEPQALLRGLVSPHAIREVVVDGLLLKTIGIKDVPPGRSMAFDVEAFRNRLAEAGHLPKVRPFHADAAPTAEDYLRELSEHFGCSRDLLVEVLVEHLLRAEHREEQIHVVMAPGSGGGCWQNPTVGYSVAKKVLPLLLDRFEIPVKPSKRPEPNRYYGF